jgi:hypothetical protein
MEKTAALLSSSYIHLWSLLSAYDYMTERLFDKDHEAYMFVYHRPYERIHQLEELACWVLEARWQLHSFDLPLTKEQMMELLGPLEHGLNEFMFQWCDGLVAAAKATHPHLPIPWNILLYVYYCGALHTTLLRFNSFVLRTAQAFPKLRAHHEQDEGNWKELAHTAEVEMDQVLEERAVPDIPRVRGDILSTGEQLAEMWETATMKAANDYMAKL